MKRSGSPSRYAAPADRNSQRLLKPRRLDVCLEFPQLVQTGFELFEEFESFIPIQGRHADWQHGDRPTSVLDELGDWQVGHRRRVGEPCVRRHKKRCAAQCTCQ